MKGDLHIHSNGSPDSILIPSEIVRIAISRGLGFLAISDHNKFSLHEGKIIMVPGEEVSSREGHILALFIDGQIPKGLTQEETVDKIHEMNGIAIAAHPFRHVNGLKAGFRNVYDAIETKNGRCSSKCNDRAEKLAEKLNKPSTAGSDAHFYEEIGRSYLEVNAEDVEGIRSAIGAGKGRAYGSGLSRADQARLYYKLAKDYAGRGFKRI